MIVVCGALAAALVAVVIMFLRHQGSQEAAWAQERRELVSRITHPEIVHTGPPVQFEMPDLEPDDSNLVGQISYDGPGGD